MWFNVGRNLYPYIRFIPRWTVVYSVVITNVYNIRSLQGCLPFHPRQHIHRTFTVQVGTIGKDGEPHPLFRIETHDRSKAWTSARMLEVKRIVGFTTDQPNP